MVKSDIDRLDTLIRKKLRPYVSKIDHEAFYAKDYLRALGEEGFFSSTNRLPKEVLSEEMALVEATAKTCMTTAFCLWCHLAALTYVRHSENDGLKEELLPLFESGQVLGATGLSNPMKFYATMERLHLKAIEVEGGYAVTGVLPAVSNLAEGHLFAFIAEVEKGRRIMAFVPFLTEGMSVKARVDYLGLNGSATYACRFDNVFIPEERVVSEDADHYVEKIRPTFVAYQIPLGIGVTEASIRCIEQVRNTQNGCNQYLPVQAEELAATLAHLRETVQQLEVSGDNFHNIASVRLETAYATLRAVEQAMLHQGGAGYLRNSHASRRLREAYFFANLTPTIKHLEKLLTSS